MMANGSRRRQQDINDEAIRRNIDPGTGGTDGALDMGMTTGDRDSNLDPVNPGTTSPAGTAKVGTDEKGFDFAGGGGAPTGGVGGGTGSGADMELTNLDSPGTTVRGRHPDDVPGRDPRSHRHSGVDDDRPNAGDASDESSFDASAAYTGIDSEDALAGSEGRGGSS